MRVAVVGCGAMGSIYAGLLSTAGSDVSVIDPWSAHVDAINNNGLRVEGASGDRIAKVKATQLPPAIQPDLIIIAAKARQISDASKLAKQLLAPQTIVLTIQNGLGSADIVASELGSERLLVGIAGGFGAELRGPGHAFHSGMSIVRMGPYDKLPFEKAERIADLWIEAGFKAEAVPDIIRMQWEKLICNVAFSAPCALTGLTVTEASQDEHIAAVGTSAAIEAWEIGRALGISIQVSDPVEYVRNFALQVPGAKPSLLQDLEAGRPTEIDVINGAVPVQAARIGKSAPVNATLAGLVRQRERMISAKKSII